MLRKKPKPGPPCPKCGGRKTAPRGDWFICHRCDMMFDRDPDEGGDYSARDPAARMMRQERQQTR